MDIIPAKLNQASEIAKIHCQALSGDFLPSLGENFLKIFYETAIGKKDIYTYVVLDKGKIGGFILGTRDSKTFFKNAIFSGFIKLMPILMIQVVKNPGLLKKVFESLFYPSKEIGPKAELVIIAISKKYQSKGLGKKLISVLEDRFIENKILEYKLTVYADKKAVGFYEHLGFKHLSNFKLYDRMWYLYSKKISERTGNANKKGK